MESNWMAFEFSIPSSWRVCSLFFLFVVMFGVWVCVWILLTVLWRMTNDRNDRADDNDNVGAVWWWWWRWWRWQTLNDENTMDETNILIIKMKRTEFGIFPVPSPSLSFDNHYSVGREEWETKFVTKRRLERLAIWHFSIFFLQTERRRRRGGDEKSFWRLFFMANLHYYCVCGESDGGEMERNDGRCGRKTLATHVVRGREKFK